MNDFNALFNQMLIALNDTLAQEKARADAAELRNAIFREKIAEALAATSNDNGTPPSPPAPPSAIVPDDEPRRRGDVKYPDKLFLDALTTVEQSQTELHAILAPHGVSVGTVYGRYTKLAADPTSGVVRGSKGWRLTEEPFGSHAINNGPIAPTINRKARRVIKSKVEKMLEAQSKRPIAANDHGANDDGARSQIITGDCLEVMRGMASGSVDLIVTSPPYNLGVSSGGGIRGARSTGRWMNAKLADGYASYDDARDPAEYSAWIKEVLTECWRLLSDTGAIFFNHKPRIQQGELQHPRDLNPGLPVRQEIIWDRGSGFNFNAGAFLSTHETITIYAKPAFRLRDGCRGLKDVWQIAPERNNDHPAPFPVELPRRAIEATDAKVIFDPFCGSGTTGVAAKMLGRKFIGIELDPGYAEGARQRIADARADTSRTQVIAANDDGARPAFAMPRDVATPLLVKGDGLAMMRNMPDRSADVVLADLPYGYPASRLSFDPKIEVQPWIDEMSRIVTAKGAIVAFGAHHFTDRLRHAAGDLFKYKIVWYKGKPTSPFQSKVRPLAVHEDIIVLSHANACSTTPKKNMIYNHGATMVQKRWPKHSGKKHMGGTHSLQPGDLHDGLTDCPHDIVYCPHDPDHHHSFQKPVPLLEYLIKMFSNDNALIVDPTMGSGSAGVAAINTSRRFIGAENGYDDKRGCIYATAERRIVAALRDRDERTV